MTEATTVRGALGSAIKVALKGRDRRAVATYRAALAAIDNAEAVPDDNADRAGAIEASAVGAGRADVARRELTEPQMREIVHGEARELCSAAELIEATQPDAAAQLRAEAQLLTDLLDRVALAG